MEKAFQVNLEITVREYPDERVIRILFHDESVALWALALCMLKEGTVETVSVHSQEFASRLQVSRTVEEEEISVVQKTRARVVSANVFARELDRWVDFFLCYVRDGYGTVDHLDLEVRSTDAGSTTSTLVLQVPNMAPPFTAEEAIRRLGA